MLVEINKYFWRKLINIYIGKNSSVQKANSNSQACRSLGIVKSDRWNPQKLCDKMPDKCLRKTGFDCHGPVLMKNKRLQFLYNYVQTRHVFSLHGTKPGVYFLLLNYKENLAWGWPTQQEVGRFNTDTWDILSNSKTFSAIAVFPLTYLQDTLIGTFWDWAGIFKCYHHGFIKEKNISVRFHLCLGFCSSRAFELP